MTDSILTLLCPHCGNHIRVPATFAGGKGLCAKCKGLIVIPRSPGRATEQPPPENPAARSPALPTPQVMPMADTELPVALESTPVVGEPKRGRRLKTAIILGGIGLLLVAGVIVAILLWTSNPEKSIVGRWKETGGEEVIEFFTDGRVTLADPRTDVTLKGHYTLDKKQVRVQWGDIDAPMWSDTLTYDPFGEELLLDMRGGQVARYRRVSSDVSGENGVGGANRANHSARPFRAQPPPAAPAGARGLGEANRTNHPAQPVAAQPPAAPKTRTAYAGTAFVVNLEGHLITTHHVIAGATKVTVELDNFRKYDAVIVAADEARDLAILKIDGKGLPFVPLQAEACAVGTAVTAFGSGLTGTGVESTTSARNGKVSVASGDAAIAVDSPLNPGFAGGPLVTAQGHAIGIVNGRLSGADVLHGGKAIPMAQAVAFLREKSIQHTPGGAAGPFDAGVLWQRIAPAVARVTTESLESTPRRWNPSRPTVLWRAPRPCDTLRGLFAVSPDGQGIALADTPRAGIIELRDGNGQAPRTLTGHTGYVGAMAFCPDGSMLASVSHAGEVMLWDTKAGTLLKSLPHDVKAVPWGPVAFTGDGALVAATMAAPPQGVMVWDVKTGNLLQTISPHFYLEVIAGFALLPGTETLLVSGNVNSPDDDYLMVFNARSGKRIRSINLRHILPERYPAGWQKDPLHVLPTAQLLTVSGDAQLVAFGFGRDEVVLAKTSDFRAFHVLPRTWQDHMYAFSPDGRIFAVGGGVRLLVDTVALYHVQTGALAWDLVGDGGRGFALTPDGKGLLRTENKEIVMWDISFLGLKQRP